jgi:hypothetical protein
MTSTRVIPTPVLRRLTLSLLGFRFSSGLWVLGDDLLSEEAVDRMSPQTWERWIGRWMTAASAMN